MPMRLIFSESREGAEQGAVGVACYLPVCPFSALTCLIKA